MTATAILCAALAAALCVPARDGLPRGAPRALPWWVVPTPLVGALPFLHGHTLVLALILAAAGLAAMRLARRSRSRRAADMTRARVVEACEAVTSELRAGQPPLTALSRSVDTWPDLELVVAACRLDADVPEAFRRLSRAPGADQLAEVASAWRLSQSVGGGLADALARASDTARGQLATHRVVAAELASAQATARMIALMPVVMLLLAGGSGADPWRFLLRTSPGLACLGVGLGLALVGMWWIDRIVASVQTGDL